MDLLNQYNEAEKGIHEYFGRSETWSVYPINDLRNMWWQILGGSVIMYDCFNAYLEQDEEHMYEAQEIMNNEIYHKHDYTMILINTHTDGNIFLTIFDNAKRIV